MAQNTLNRIREELDRLSKLIDAWDDLRDVSALERDLALAKLRELYDILLLAGDLSPASRSAQEPVQDEELPAVSLDLDGILSLGLISQQDDPAEAQSQTETPVLESAPAAETLHQVVAEPESAPAAEIPHQVEAEPESAPVSEVDAVEPEIESTPEPDAIAEPEPEPAFEEHSAPTSEEQPDLETESQPAASPALSESVSQPMLAGLFGLDEEEAPTHHRRKQRVIMSLYDNDPPARSGNPDPDDVFEEIDLSQGAEPSHSDGPQATPSELSDPAGPIAPDDESYGGEEPQAEEFAESDEPSPEAPADSPLQETTASAVLGDVLNHRVKTLSDTLAAHPAEVGSHRLGLRASLGLNDRFLLIRDLFDGDAAACDAALDELNGFDDLDDCMIHIAENYTWNPDCDGAKFLMELLERKYA